MCIRDSTYSWRGKEDDITRYRVILNDGQTYPDYVDDTQRAVSYTHLAAAWKT